MQSKNCILHSAEQGRDKEHICCLNLSPPTAAAAGESKAKNNEKEIERESGRVGVLSTAGEAISVIVPKQRVSPFVLIHGAAATERDPLPLQEGARSGKAAGGTINCLLQHDNNS